MTDFEKAISFVLAHEGGYVNHPEDPGEETNFGISKRAYRSLDIKALTIERAKEIYKKDYWEKAHCDELAWPLNLAMLDFAVNSGASSALKLLQKVAGVKVDGRFGPKTFAAINMYEPKELAKRLVLTRVDFLLNINNPSFYRGWMRRTHELMYEIGKA